MHSLEDSIFGSLESRHDPDESMWESPDSNVTHDSFGSFFTSSNNSALCESQSLNETLSQKVDGEFLDVLFDLDQGYRWVHIHISFHRLFIAVYFANPN